MHTALIRGAVGPWKKAESGEIESLVLEGSAHPTITCSMTDTC